MRVLYCLILLFPAGCQSETDNASHKPNAYRDLLVDRVVWATSEATKPGDVPMNQHRFTLTNTSDAYSYDQIEVRFDYFDSTYHKIRSYQTVLNKSIGPRAALVVGEVQDSLVSANARSSTVTVVTATHHQAEPEK